MPTKLTKREEYAKAAMQGILTGLYTNLDSMGAVRITGAKEGLATKDVISRMAFEIADTMLEKE